MSCEEDPTSVGNDLLPPGDLVDFVVFDSDSNGIGQESAYFREELFLGDAQQVLIGKYNGLKSTAMMRFHIPITIETGRLIDSNEINLLTAKLILQPNYILGDENAAFDMTIHTINTPWSVDSFTVDSLHSLEYNHDDIASNWDYNDSTITFNLSTDMIYAWMVAELDTNIDNPNGLLFKPNEASDKILGFRAFGPNAQNLQTLMEIAYEGIGYDGEVFTDTLWATLTSDLHVVEGQITETNEDLIVLHGGLGGRGAIKFDISSIPQNSIINHAQLELHFDSLSSVLGSPFTDSVLVSLMSDYDSRISLDSLGGFYLGRDGYIFSGPITRFVQRWLYDEENNGIVNNGLKITLADELESANKAILYGSSVSDPTLKPRLKIIYSRKIL